MQNYYIIIACLIPTIVIIIGIYYSDKLRTMVNILDFYINIHKMDILNYLSKKGDIDLENNIKLTELEFDNFKQYILNLIKSDHNKYTKEEIKEFLRKNLLFNDTGGFYWINDRLKKHLSKKIVLDKKKI